jgi:hypothetical protein
MAASEARRTVKGSIRDCKTLKVCRNKKCETTLLLGNRSEASVWPAAAAGMGGREIPGLAPLGFREGIRCWRKKLIAEHRDFVARRG